MATTVYELEARTAKAIKLSRYLQSQNASAEQVARMDDADWKAVAPLAGVKVPSQETRKLVVSCMKAAEETTAKYASDPFAGFPGAVK